MENKKELIDYLRSEYRNHSEGILKKLNKEGYELGGIITLIEELIEE